MARWDITPNDETVNHQGGGVFVFYENTSDEERKYTIKYTDDDGCTAETEYKIPAGCQPTPVECDYCTASIPVLIGGRTEINHAEVLFGYTCEDGTWDDEKNSGITTNDIDYVKIQNQNTSHDSDITDDFKEKLNSYNLDTHMFTLNAACVYPDDFVINDGDIVELSVGLKDVSCGQIDNSYQISHFKHQLFITWEGINGFDCSQWEGSQYPSIKLKLNGQSSPGSRSICQTNNVVASNVISCQTDSDEAYELFLQNVFGAIPSDLTGGTINMQIIVSDFGYKCGTCSWNSEGTKTYSSSAKIVDEIGKKTYLNIRMNGSCLNPYFEILSWTTQDQI